ncbi:MAG: hypothetical protein HQK61_07560, partial [Desulfamplus sp.]|nr:hypothetical protein [Desulfamplus sp.]
TIPCPVCHNGTIKQEKTETGKEYFICSDRNCRFVSWSQPYHFPCPLCKNSFLVDFRTGQGTKGLKCPRASCTFSQNSLSDPALARNIASDNAIPQAAGHAHHPDSSNQPAGYPPQPGYSQPHGYTPQPGQPPGEAPPKKKRLVRRVKKKS